MQGNGQSYRTAGRHPGHQRADKANVAVGKAAILQARDDLVQAQAVLSCAKRNLSYCTITSPVKGVIIDRRVNIRQTVVYSLNAPSLFLIAKDLTRIQIWVVVNEADIGKIHPGLPRRPTDSPQNLPESCPVGSCPRRPWCRSS